MVVEESAHEREVHRQVVRMGHPLAAGRVELLAPQVRFLLPWELLPLRVQDPLLLGRDQGFSSDVADDVVPAEPFRRVVFLLELPPVEPEDFVQGTFPSPSLLQDSGFRSFLPP